MPECAVASSGRVDFIDLSPFYLRYEVQHAAQVTTIGAETSRPTTALPQTRAFPLVRAGRTTSHARGFRQAFTPAHDVLGGIQCDENLDFVLGCPGECAPDR